MEGVSLGSAPSASVSNAVQAKVSVKQGDQLEAVVGKLLDGVKESTEAVRQAGQTGQRLNLLA